MATPSTTNPTPINYSLEFLCSLISCQFTGNRYELGEFLANCNNANNLATAEQRLPLLYFILSQIKGKTKEQLARVNFRNWEELKEQLKVLFQDKKHYYQLVEELSNIRQFSNETITDYYNKLENLNSRIISSIQQFTINAAEIPGKIKFVNDITLNRFIFHSKPEISQMLRWKEFSNLTSAHTAAVNEEQALKIHSKFNTPFYSKQPTSTNTPIRNFDIHKTCTYCKNAGHTINECRKRAFNNERKVHQNNQSNFDSVTNSNPRHSFNNSQYSRQNNTNFSRQTNNNSTTQRTNSNSYQSNNYDTRSRPNRNTTPSSQQNSRQSPSSRQQTSNFLEQSQIPQNPLNSQTSLTNNAALEIPHEQTQAFDI